MTHRGVVAADTRESAPTQQRSCCSNPKPMGSGPQTRMTDKAMHQGLASGRNWKHRLSDWQSLARRCESARSLGSGKTTRYQDYRCPRATQMPISSSLTDKLRPSCDSRMLRRHRRAGTSSALAGSSAYMADITTRAPAHRAKILGFQSTVGC